MGPTKRQPEPPRVSPPETAIGALPEGVRAHLPLDDSRFAAELGRVLDFSDYAAGVVRREPEWLAAVWSDGTLGAPFEAAGAAALTRSLPETADENAFMAALRRDRHHALLGILWRDLNGRADLAETLHALSRLAETLIDAAVTRAEADLTARHGRPRDAAGAAQRPVVIGLGKLGGGELNFSSDVDLLFSYPRAGHCDGPRALSNEQYFAGLVRSVTRLLAEPTADGFVYRVDLRLRPFGDAGRPALSFASMEQYYQRDGRDWERYALVKARPIAGDLDAGRELLGSLRPFVYRRYLDYAAFDALREMKAMIRAEVARRELVADIKRGPGGIREIEFIAQTMQLVRGGQEPALRDVRLRPVLARLGRMGLLEPDVAGALAQAYCFLRTLENRLQQMGDRQTHRLPSEPALRRRLSRSLGYPDFAALEADLARHRERVEETFENLFAPPASERDDHWRIVWEAAVDQDHLAALISEAGFRDPDSARRLGQFRRGTGYRALGERARRRVDRLLPRLLETAAAGPSADRTLRRVLRVVAQIAARSAYVALLCERPPVLAQLVHLCRRSAWLTDLMARQPALLDELIGPGRPEPGGSVESRIEARVTGAEDAEGELSLLRRAQQSELLAIAVERLNGLLDAQETARRLSVLADAVLAVVHRLAWRDLAARHGVPAGEPGIAIIGYGTLGGRELNFNSDLDLVFLYRDDTGDGAVTDGSRPLDCQAFYTRVSQRMLHMLTTLMPAGRLYRVDTRLRPNGNAGFLVSSLSAFAAYQREQAWTWELQALSRARWVAGERALAGPFAALREEVVQRRRDLSALRRDVVEMREKMRARLDRSDDRGFDLKHGRGGKIDVEFIAQYARLAWGCDCPELAAAAGTLETLEALSKTELLPPVQVEALSEAYRRYQALAQENALEGRAENVPPERCGAVAEAVAAIWSELFAA